MKVSRVLALALVAGSLGVWASGCGDDEELGPDKDAGGLGDGASFDGNPQGGDGGGDGQSPSGCGDPKGAPERLLLTINGIGDGGKGSELAVFDMATKTVAGRYAYASTFATTYAFGTDPYVIAEEQSQVVRMDAREPWKAIATWNLQGDDVPDSGKYSEPTAVAVPSCKQGYVTRFERNKLALIDTSAPGGGITKYIDLNAFKNGNDTDGRVEPISALWVASHKRVYVLLGGIDINKVATGGFPALCADTHPLVIAIDPETDSVVSLGGTGPGGAIELGGYSPVVANNTFLYDAALDRLLVMSAGCNVDAGGGVAGALDRRRVEEVQLATSQVRTLLELGTDQFPLGLVYVDASRAAVAMTDEFFTTKKAFFWDPQSTSLGAEVPGGLESIAYDGKGNLVGMRAVPIDGGPGVEVVRVPFSDAGAVDAASVERLGVNPFSANGGFLAGADYWPRP